MLFHIMLLRNWENKISDRNIISKMLYSYHVINLINMKLILKGKMKNLNSHWMVQYTKACCYHKDIILRISVRLQDQEITIVFLTNCYNMGFIPTFSISTGFGE